MIGAARRRAAHAAVLAAAVMLAGCSPEPTSTPIPTPTRVPLPTPVTTTYAVGVTAWYAGLVLHIGSATSILDPGGGSVTVDLTIENPGEAFSSLTAPIALVAGERRVEPAHGTVIPDVRAGESALSTIQFDVDAAFDVTKSALRVGRQAEHEVVVPLVPGDESLVTLEPIALTLDASGVAGLLAVTLTGGELRADLPDWGLEMARDTLALTLTYTARYRGDFSGGFAFTGANVNLRLPDGTTIAARADGHSQSVAVLLPGVTSPGLIARFDVPVPGTGDYALEITDGSTNRAIPFTIEAAASGG